MPLEYNPLQVKCRSCAAPAEYDIVTRNYRCQYCGGSVSVKKVHAGKAQWRDARQVQFKQEAHSLREQVYECPNCGARVVMPAGEALSTCEFCGGKPVRNSFMHDEVFPQVIIGFRLTLDEAKERLLQWCKDNEKHRKECAAIRQHIDELHGYYLPYQLVRGGVDCTVRQNDATRKFHLRGYVDGIAINASSQLRNEVLDAMEPYSWDEAAPFDFGYVAGQHVKLQDADKENLEIRTTSEVEESYRPAIVKAMGTKNIAITAGIEDSFVMPALLPAYVLKTGFYQVAVNGQTGKVAVESHTTYTRGLPWFVYPFIWTLLAFALCTLGVFVGMGAQSWEEPSFYGAMLAFFVFLVSMVAFHDRGDTRRYDQPIYASNTICTGRDESNKLIIEPEKPKTLVDPVFIETIGKSEVPVHVRFWTPARIAKWALLLVLWNVFPLILGCIWAGFNFAQMWPEGNCIWMLVSVPTTFVFMFKLGQIDIYDSPELYRVLKDGSHKRLTLDEIKGKKKAKGPKEWLGRLYDRYGGFLVILIFPLICSLVIAFGNTI